MSSTGHAQPVAGERLRRTALARPQAVGELRREVAAYAKELGASNTAREAVALAVSEALTNAVVHAYLGQEPGPIAVEAWYDGEGQLLVLVSDEGKGMLARTDSPGLGVGMPLIAQMADDVHVASRDEPGGTLVSMRFSLDGSGVSLPGDPAAADPGHDRCVRS
jgi:serine/threonine-protein kinase RsbW/stage II sporulation protein AB (anti-sigma F factor)